jgi:hypothetical protein
MISLLQRRPIVIPTFQSQADRVWKRFRQQMEDAEKIMREISGFRLLPMSVESMTITSMPSNACMMSAQDTVPLLRLLRLRGLTGLGHKKKREELAPLPFSCLA